VVALHVCNFPQANDDGGLGHGEMAIETEAIPRFLSVLLCTHSLIQSLTITALKVAVAAIAVVLPMTAHDDK